jgi:predicted MFS family arabinose efflux permease
MQKAKGVLGAAAQTGSVVAYSVGGVIAADLTVSRMMITIVMGAIAVSTAAALSFGLRGAPIADDGDRPRSRRLLATAWAAIRHTPELRRLLLLAIATNAFGAHLLVFYQQYFLETGVPGVWFGLALSLASILVVLGQLHAWRLPAMLGNRRSLALTTGVPGLLYLAMAWNQHPALAVALFVTQWGAIHVSLPLFSGLYNAHLPDHARATGLSLISAIVTIYIGIGGVVLGWAAERSLPAMFAALGAVIAAGAIGIRVDDRTATDTVASTSASLQ